MQVMEKHEAKRITHLLGLLSVRERQLVKYFATGYSNVEIALLLNIAATTVKVHKGHIYKKLGVSTLKDLMHLLDVKPTHPLE
jgi:DNA-binding CsgD family transcriptional regulator